MRLLPRSIADAALHLRTHLRLSRDDLRKSVQVVREFVPKIIPTFRKKDGVIDWKAVKGAAWVTVNGLRGVLLPVHSPPLDHFPSVEDGFHFADHPPLLNEILFKIFGKEHEIYNRLGLIQTYWSLGKALSCYAHVLGIRQYFEDYLATLEGTERLPPEKPFIEWARLIDFDWALQYAKINGWNVRFEGVERIPKEGHAVYAVAPHDGIFDDLFFTFDDPRMIPVADAHNFRNNESSKKYGVAMIVDRAGCPLVNRQDRNDTSHLEQSLQASIQYGLRPGWFVNGGRVPRSYRDDGRFDRPGYYSSSPDPGNPRIYVQMEGVVGNAFKLARRTRGPVSIILCTLRGNSCMPKVAKDFPFRQPNIAREEIVYRVTQPFIIDHKYKELRTLGEEINAILKKDLEIDAYLRTIVEGWGAERGEKDLAEKFDARAEGDEAYRIIADRIRSIHPSLKERNQYVGRLLELICSDTPPERQKVNELLKGVTEKMLETQYHRF